MTPEVYSKRIFDYIKHILIMQMLPIREYFYSLYVALS